MLAITEDAAAAIQGIVASSGLPEGAGLRITQELNTETQGAARTDLRLSLVESAEEGDEVLEGTQIFLEPDAAEFLDNKLLDADVVEGEEGKAGEVRFSLDVQAETLGSRPSPFRSSDRVTPARRRGVAPDGPAALPSAIPEGPKARQERLPGRRVGA